MLDLVLTSAVGLQWCPFPQEAALWEIILGSDHLVENQCHAESTKELAQFCEINLY